MRKGLSIGSYDLEQAEIVSCTNKVADVSSVFISLNLFEDIFGNVVSGSLSFRDSQNLSNSLPIIGQEKIKITFKSSSYSIGDATNSISMVFDIYKVGARFSETEGTQSTIVYFCSEEMEMSAKQKLSRSYKGKSEDIIYDVLRKQLGSKKTLVSMESKQDHHIVVPNWPPLYLCNWLAKRTVANDARGSNYVFFETSKNKFMFVSMEGLFTQPTQNVYTNRPVRVSNKIGEPTREHAMQNILDLNVNDSFDTASKLSQGMFGNSVYMFDPITKAYTKNSFGYRPPNSAGYLGAFSKYRHLETNPSPLEGNSRDLKGGRLSDYEDAELRFYPEHTGFVTGKSVNAHTWYPQRISLMQQIDYHKISIVVYGDSAMKAGDIVEVEIPQKSIIVGKRKFDALLSGRYLVTAIKHSLVAADRSYTMVLELARDSLQVPINEL